MERYTGKRVGPVLLVLAAAVRLLTAAGPETVEAKQKTGDLLYQAAAMGTGTVPMTADKQAKDTVWVVRQRPEMPEVLPADPEPAPEEVPDQPACQTPVFAAAEAEDIAVAGRCTYKVDKASLLLAPTAPFSAEEGPRVLILHTHTSEAYTQSAGWFYEETDPMRTLQPDQSVVRVGAEIAAVLEEAGIGVIHDTSYNDYPDYNSSYSGAGKKTARWLEQYPSLQVVLDIHRDAVEAADGTPVHMVTELPDGTEAARLMLVVGTDQGGAQHPDWEKNLSWALKVQALLERSSPGLCRSLDLRTERFNQHLSPMAMLVEVGSTGNTMPEALAAARVLAETLTKLIPSS